MTVKDKIQSLSNLGKILLKLKKQGKTIGLITGCFDVFHIGHVETLNFAKKHCDILIVGLDNDRTVAINKGGGETSLYI
jgi:D-beta-D-heptose 7-phosphate kinase/D-beta-D-heptose 1-phosphate adenosyltransferase